MGENVAIGPRCALYASERGNIEFDLGVIRIVNRPSQNMDTGNTAVILFDERTQPGVGLYENDQVGDHRQNQFPEVVIAVVGADLDINAHTR